MKRLSPVRNPIPAFTGKKHSRRTHISRRFGRYSLLENSFFVGAFPANGYSEFLLCYQSVRVVER
jgi:hypothetical protein